MQIRKIWHMWRAIPSLWSSFAPTNVHKGVHNKNLWNIFNIKIITRSEQDWEWTRRSNFGTRSILPHRPLMTFIFIGKVNKGYTCPAGLVPHRNGTPQRLEIEKKRQSKGRWKEKVKSIRSKWICLKTLRQQ